MDKIFKIRCSQIGKIMSNARKAGELSATCTSYLKDWYTGEHEDIFSKYMDKGNAVENELIDFMAEVMGYGLAEKNEVYMEDSYITGTADVVMPKLIVDVKAPWSKKTLQDSSLELNMDYYWQGQGYMHLYGKDEFILFYGLMDTPGHCNYGNEVIYSTMPRDDRWAAFRIQRNDEDIKSIIEKVDKCREWLNEYDVKLCKTIGKIQTYPTI